MKKTLRNDITMLSALTKRHMKIFFKDKAAVFFAFLAPFILLFLYLAFINDSISKGITAGLDGAAKQLLADGVIKETFVTDKVKQIVISICNASMFGGLLSITSLTVAFSSQNLMVQDKEEGRLADMFVSPVKRIVISSSYLIYTFITALLINYLMLAVVLIWTAATGWYLSVGAVFALIGLVPLAVLISTVIGWFLCSFVKTGNAHGAMIGIISSIGGFLVGSFMPIGQLPSAVQYIVLFIPGAYLTTMFKNILMTPVIGELTKLLPETIKEKQATGMMESWTTKMDFFGVCRLEMWQMILISIGWLAVFIGLIVLTNFLMNKKGKKEMLPLKNKLAE